jgi:flagellar motility protein MotE (MotC chaperone)
MISNTSPTPSETASTVSSKKEIRRARNRLTAKKSRDKRASHIRELERDLKAANERIAALENELLASRSAELYASFGYHTITPANMGIILDE